MLSLYRKRARLSQWELGRLLGVGQKTVSDWETGKEIPNSAVRQQVAEILQQDTKTLFP